MSFNPFMHNVVKWPNILQKGLLLLILEKNPDVLQGPRRVSDYCKEKDHNFKKYHLYQKC